MLNTETALNSSSEDRTTAISLYSINDDSSRHSYCLEVAIPLKQADDFSIFLRKFDNGLNEFHSDVNKVILVEMTNQEFNLNYRRFDRTLKNDPKSSELVFQFYTVRTSFDEIKSEFLPIISMLAKIVGEKNLLDKLNNSLTFPCLQYKEEEDNEKYRIGDVRSYQIFVGCSVSTTNRAVISQPVSETHQPSQPLERNETFTYRIAHGLVNYAKNLISKITSNITPSSFSLEQLGRNFATRLQEVEATLLEMTESMSGYQDPYANDARGLVTQFDASSKSQMTLECTEKDTARQEKNRGIGFRN